MCAETIGFWFLAISLAPIGNQVAGIYDTNKQCEEANLIAGPPWACKYERYCRKDEKFFKSRSSYLAGIAKQENK